MYHRFQRASLVPDGFSVYSVQIAGGSVQIQLRSRSRSGVCPDCERFDDRVLARYSRRTQRLGAIKHHLGLALGGRPAVAFANRLMMPVSNDTLLRVVRRPTTDRNDKLSVIGIDDFAFRRDQTYGTIVCDLERRNPITPFSGFALETSRS